ncbi:MAG: co-chaperone GroES [Cyclobacteriaceae bacterium]
MEITADNKLKKLVIVGDRVLIKPSGPDEKTKGGLYLPPGVHEKEKVRSGYIMKTGPGYPMPLAVEDSEPWKDKDEQVKYIPLQVKEGDKALFLQSSAFEIMYQDQKYFVVSQSAILMVEREEDLLS